MTVYIKEWKANQINEEASRYNTYLNCEYDERDIAIDNHYVRVRLLKETEKAYQFNFSSGDVVGSYKGWITWVPKSTVQAIFREEEV